MAVIVPADGRIVIYSLSADDDSVVNLKVELDGRGMFWATSRIVGAGPGTYHWLDTRNPKTGDFWK